MSPSLPALLILVAACGPLAAPRPAPITVGPLGAALDAIALRYHAAGTFDGVVVIARGDHVIYRAAFGEADRAAHVSHRVDEVWRLASLTKQVTALLVMQEVEAGRLALDQPLATALPAFPAHSGAITIRQLLQHTSGLPNPDDGAPDGQVPAFYRRTDPGAGDHARVADTVCGGPPRAAGAFAYNNCDYLVLGAILERATGQRYDSLIATRIARLLGVSFALAGATTPASPVVGYLASGAIEPPQNLATYGAGGALSGTADDVIRWSQALLEHRLVSAATTAIMFDGRPEMSMEALGSWAYTLPFPGRAPLALVERQGAIGGVRLVSLLSPSDGFAIIVLANTERAELFDLWTQRGLPYELARALATAPR